MSVDIQNMFFYLEQIGFLELFLPFLIIFGILYAVLGTVEIFKANKIRGLLSLTIAFLLVSLHVTNKYPGQLDVVVIINTLLPASFLVLLGVFLLLILLSVVTKKQGIKDNPLYGLVAFLGLGALLFVIIYAVQPERLPDWLNILSEPNTQSLLIVGLVISAILALLWAKPTKKTWVERVHKVMKDLTGEN
jgi:hypothetical protein